MKDPVRVTSLTRVWKMIRRAVSRNEWSVGLLGLSRDSTSPTRRGLILIQIDGLSRSEWERVKANGQLPFLNKLMEQESFNLHTLYSGMPSNTAGFQGEFLYGVDGVIPGTAYRNHRNGRQVHVYDYRIASDIQERLENQDPGLLRGGSSYCNIYNGGAAESYFCATSQGWDSFFDAVSPLRLFVVMLLHLGMFFRMLGLAIIELVLLFLDLFKPGNGGLSWWQSVSMIPARILTVVLLRELVVAGVSYDAARGLPVIHVSLLGYDEQARRRGPRSRYAVWTLRGIDRAIGRIWRAAHRGQGREYDVWIFSDHGQSTATSYQRETGKPIQQAVLETAGRFCDELSGPRKRRRSPRHPSRAHWLGWRRLNLILAGEPNPDSRYRTAGVQTVTSGSLAFVYLLRDNLRPYRTELAQSLVRDQRIPLVVFRDHDQQVKAITPEGEFLLPADAVRVFGARYPFLNDISNDLIKLVMHVDSGDLVLVGWRPGDTTCAFSPRIGVQGGPGPEECGGFALLPVDAPIDANHKNYLRPAEFRQAAQRFLGLDQNGRSFHSPSSTDRQSVRILTYNVHACVGMDGQLSPERIARVISQTGADIICLQELDVNRVRSGKRNQAQEIARHLAMNYHFHPAWNIEEESFGNAVLSRFPMRLIQARGIHHHKANRSKRGAMWVQVDVDRQFSLQVIAAHLSIYPKEQKLQATELIEEWVKPANLVGPAILCGDFNARPGSAAYREIIRSMRDVESFSERVRHQSTYFSPRPFTRLDHIFVTDELVTQHCQVVATRLAKNASDHLPLLADLKLSVPALVDQN